MVRYSLVCDGCGEYLDPVGGATGLIERERAAGCGWRVSGLRSKRTSRDFCFDCVNAGLHRPQVDVVRVNYVLAGGRLDTLTVAERRVAAAELLARGRPTVGVASSLGVSTRTVQRYRRRRDEGVVDCDNPASPRRTTSDEE